MDDDDGLSAALAAVGRNVPATVTTYICTMEFRGRTRPVLVLSINDAVAWAWIYERKALWGSGSLATGKADIHRCFAGSVSSDFALLGELAGDWYSDVLPPDGQQAPAPMEAVREFVRCIEGGETAPARPAQARQSGMASTVAAVASRPDATAVNFNPYFHTREKFPPASGFTDADLDGVPLVTVHPAAIPAAVAGFLLLVAILGAPYPFYDVVRWAVTAMAIWAAVVAVGQKRTAWELAFGATAVLFNPFIPVYLTREAWVPLDAAALVLFITAGVKLRASRPATAKDGPQRITG